MFQLEYYHTRNRPGPHFLFVLYLHLLQNWINQYTHFCRHHKTINIFHLNKIENVKLDILEHMYMHIQYFWCYDIGVLLHTTPFFDWKNSFCRNIFHHIVQGYSFEIGLNLAFCIQCNWIWLSYPWKNLKYINK